MNTTPPDRSDQLRMDGSGVEQMARDAVSTHGHFFRRGDQFEFFYRDGVLEIRGTAHSYYLKQVLQTVLQDLVNGSCRIDNQVIVVPRHDMNGNSSGPTSAARRVGPSAPIY
jgi:hypothetical protein